MTKTHKTIRYVVEILVFAAVLAYGLYHGCTEEDYITGLRIFGFIVVTGLWIEAIYKLCKL